MSGDIRRRLVEWRQVIAPAAGALVVLLVTLAAPGQLLWALLTGALTWAGTALVLSPASPFAWLRGRNDLAMDAAAMEAELMRAKARIETIGDCRQRLGDPLIGHELALIADTASAILDDVGSRPEGYPQVRKALVHYLAHVEAIATGVVRIEDAGGDDDVLEHVRHTLPRLGTILGQYRKRAVERDVFDIETRIDMLQQELQQAVQPRNKAERP